MAKTPPKARLVQPADERLDDAQRAMRDAILASRPGLKALSGPFGVWLHAPQLGDLAQRVGAYCRYKTSLPPRLSEFAILCMARLWRAQYEWHAHAPIAEKAGVKQRAIAEIKAGRYPKTAAADERALYDFIAELNQTRRVSDPTYRRAHKILGDTGLVELVGILGYYTLISMTLNVFNVPLPPNTPLPLAEPATKRKARGR
jgi:4-carboxymuconolactone decarboxylase